MIPEFWRFYALFMLVVCVIVLWLWRIDNPIPMQRHLKHLGFQARHTVTVGTQQFVAYFYPGPPQISLRVYEATGRWEMQIEDIEYEGRGLRQLRRQLRRSG